MLRRRRLRHFSRLVEEARDETGKTVRILDIGGRVNYWLAMADLIPLDAVEITILNLSVNDCLTGLPRDFDITCYPFKPVAGDACALDYPDGAFDVIHSNSVIEHLGDWDNMRLAAGQIERLAARYFVQVPYFWFPYEPHFKTMFFHWLPENLRVKRLMARKVGWYGPASDYETALKIVRSAQLPDKLQMKLLFPGAQIVSEQLGLTKSLMAIRN